MNKLRNCFTAYAATFFIDQRFMQHGLLLLSRIIDLEASTRNVIQFQQAPVEYPHLIALDKCRNLVYLRVWDASNMTIFERDTMTLTLS
jgi:hypothetical protein